AKPTRFKYYTESWAGVAGPPVLPVEGPSPSMATTELTVSSLYAYQIIQNTAGGVQNNTLYFRENGGATCVVTVPTGFYPQATTPAVCPPPPATPLAANQCPSPAGSLAAALTAAMNSCVGKVNTYNVTYGSVTANRFTFATTNAGPVQFRLQWATGTNSI